MARKLLRIYLLSLWLLVASAPALAVPESSEELAQEISETTMSPFCPGRTISSCPSPQARELRSQIRSWFDGGSTKEQVIERLLTAYGEDVRGEPQAEGFGLFGWLIPPLFILASFLFVLRKLRRMRRVEESGTQVSDPDSVAKQRVADELKARLS